MRESGRNLAPALNSPIEEGKAIWAPELVFVGASFYPSLGARVEYCSLLLFVAQVERKGEGQKEEPGRAPLSCRYIDVVSRRGPGMRRIKVVFRDQRIVKPKPGRSRGHSFPCRKEASQVSWAEVRMNRRQSHHGHWGVDLFRQWRERALGWRTWAGRELRGTDGRHFVLFGRVLCGVWWYGSNL